MQETQIQSLNGEDPLEKGMTAHSNILAWRIPWTEEPGRLQSLGSQRVRYDSVTQKKKKEKSKAIKGEGGFLIHSYFFLSDTLICDCGLAFSRIWLSLCK